MKKFLLTLLFCGMFVSFANSSPEEIVNNVLFCSIILDKNEIKYDTNLVSNILTNYLVLNNLPKNEFIENYINMYSSTEEHFGKDKNVDEHYKNICIDIIFKIDEFLNLQEV